MKFELVCKYRIFKALHRITLKVTTNTVCMFLVKTFSKNKSECISIRKDDFKIKKFFRTNSKDSSTETFLTK